MMSVEVRGRTLSMMTVGETLRRERLKRNLDLDQVSRELKISPRFLEAIEDENFEQAAQLRDEIKRMSTQLGNLATP